IKIKINPDKIRDVIGPGGKVIRALVEETGAKIDVEDDGTVSIATADSAAAEAAVNRIRGLTAEAEIGQTYVGTVSRIVDFGAFAGDASVSPAFPPNKRAKSFSETGIPSALALFS